MTVINQDTTTTYTGNGSVTSFAYTFKLVDADDLKVKVAGVLQDPGVYSVTGVGNAGGGNVVFNTAPTGEVLLYRDIAYDRTFDYAPSGDLLADDFDRDLDRIVMQIQQLNNYLKRAIKLPAGTTIDQVLAGSAADRAGKIISFDANGDLMLASGAELDAAITSFGAGLAQAGEELSVLNYFTTISASADAGGTVNVITATISPVPGSLMNNLRAIITAAGANTSTTPTLNLNTLGAKTIVKNGGVALQKGDITGAGHRLDLIFDAGIDKWILQNPAYPISSGSILQVVNYQTGAYATGSGTIPLDNSTPQISEGNEFMTLAITPKSADSYLCIDIVLQLGASIISTVIAALFVDATSNALAAAVHRCESAGTSLSYNVKFTHRVSSGSITARTYRVRAGLAAAGTCYFNGGVGTLNGKLASSITITEILQ